MRLELFYAEDIIAPMTSNEMDYILGLRYPDTDRDTLPSFIVSICDACLG